MIGTAPNKTMGGALRGMTRSAVHISIGNSLTVIVIMIIVVLISGFEE